MNRHAETPSDVPRTLQQHRRPRYSRGVTLARFQTRRWRSLLLLPLLFALVFRAFIPAGYMPIVGNDGHFNMVLCSDGLNAKLTSVPAQIGDPAEPEHDTSGAQHGPCVYAAAAHSMGAPAAAVLHITASVKLLPPASALHGRTPPGDIPRAQSPRAPPTIS